MNWQSWIIVGVIAAIVITIIVRGIINKKKGKGGCGCGCGCGGGGCGGCSACSSCEPEKTPDEK